MKGKKLGWLVRITKKILNNERSAPPVTHSQNFFRGPPPQVFFFVKKGCRQLWKDNSRKIQENADKFEPPLRTIMR